MSGDEQKDQLAILRAELDQMLSLAPELARSAQVWYDAFRAKGFGDSAALYLTAAQLTQSPGKAP